MKSPFEGNTPPSEDIRSLSEGRMVPLFEGMLSPSEEHVAAFRRHFAAPAHP